MRDGRPAGVIKVTEISAHIVAAFALPAAAADLIPAAVVSVYDGDTITVLLPSGDKTRIRLIGIDAPELNVITTGRRSGQAACRLAAGGEYTLRGTGVGSRKAKLMVNYTGLGG